MLKDEKRKKMLGNFINFEGDLQQISKQILEHGWDYEGDPVIITKENVRNVLQNYIEGKITSEDVQKWADFLEVREDVDYFEHDEDVLSQIIHELANPDIEGVLSLDRAKNVLKSKTI
ncbi:MAG: hypothetical protein MRY79_04020 [Alphaproteobacteria bacterium]|nr:hypothetical protein [Alphaproteobacteria bacterium]